jgi:hypothetical protein
MEERFVLNGDGTAMKTQPDREQSRTDAEQTNSETQDVNHADTSESQAGSGLAYQPGEMGGRALKRLHQFELERGLEFADIGTENIDDTAQEANSESKEEIEEEPYKKASHKPGEMGGRALGRLHQFELERGLDLTEIESEEKDSEERDANEGGAQNV